MEFKSSLIKLEDLKLGETYVITIPGYNNYKIIHKIEKLADEKYKTLGNYLTNFGGEFWSFTYSSVYLGDDRNIRLADKNERLWLDECIAVKRFISLEDVLNKKKFRLWRIA